MWYNDFSDRLGHWDQLRREAQDLPLEPALILINQWWSNTPWTPYYLHWDDQPVWPDPWQLLSDNTYCELARALGIMYTISLLDRADMASAELVLTKNYANLVLLQKKKYILNWDPTSIVNTGQEVEIQAQIPLAQIAKQYQ